MKIKYKEGDKVWIIIGGARPKQKIVKSITPIQLQNSKSILYELEGSYKRYDHEVWPSKLGATLKK